MAEGKVLAAARARGLDSLTQVAKALVDQHPALFDGVAVRSLGAKLSELNRENTTWWRNRADRLKALETLIGLETKELVATDQARRRGMWVCDEFPELPALNLLTEQPPTLVDTVVTSAHGSDLSNLDDWLRIGLGSEHAQVPLNRLGEGVQWLHAPKGTGRNLLLARLQTRDRVDVILGEALAELVPQVSPLRPVVLAPNQATTASELVALAHLDPEQPVLVVSAHPLPRTRTDAPARSMLPNWEWMSASPIERRRSAFVSAGTGMSGGIFQRHPIVEYRLQVTPKWRTQLLQWVEGRLSRPADTLFSAEGLSKWLNAFDPDEVLFPTPAVVLSLARICHEVGERQLPEPDRSDAGVRLVKQLSRADSRYISLLTRLVAQRWLDASRPWHQARAWDEWGTPTPPKRLPPGSEKSSSSRVRAGADATTSADLVPLTASDLDAAVKVALLVPDSDGNYGFKSQAEAALALRDQLRNWMQSGDLSKWGAQAVGDEERQQLLESVLASLDSSALFELCRQAGKLPIWSAGALGSSETLFIAAGLRMAAGTLSYRAELGELLEQVFARCLSDEEYVALPLSRSLASESSRLDWVRSCWGWSLIAPKPIWIPRSVAENFPCWGLGDVTWLSRMPVPEGPDATLSEPHIKRLTATAHTAADVAARLETLPPDAPAVIKALVGLLLTAQGRGGVQAVWWHDIAHHTWALRALDLSLATIEPAAHLRLVTSLLEACRQKKEDRYSVHDLARSHMWLRVLDVKDAAGLCSELSPGDVAFIAYHIQAFPPLLRRAVADKVDPAQLPFGFEWESLLGATGVPSEERLEQLMDIRYVHMFGVAKALWRLHPRSCLEWARSSSHPHQWLFLDVCPVDFAPELAATLTRDPSLFVDPKTHFRWLTTRIAGLGYRAPALLEVLSLSYARTQASGHSSDASGLHDTNAVPAASQRGNGRDSN